MSDMVRSEYTKDMPEDYVTQAAQDVAAMTEAQVREYVESFDPDAMGFSGKEGI